MVIVVSGRPLSGSELSGAPESLFSGCPDLLEGARTLAARKAAQVRPEGVVYARQKVRRDDTLTHFYLD